MTARIFFVSIFFKRRHRLVARTHGSQPCNTGSIPVGGTTKKLFGFSVKIWLAACSVANPKILVAYDALRKALKEQLEADGKLLEKF